MVKRLAELPDDFVQLSVTTFPGDLMPSLVSTVPGSMWYTQIQACTHMHEGKQIAFKIRQSEQS